MPRDLPMACSLTASYMEARLHELRSFGETSLLDSSADAQGVRLRFRGGPAVAARLREVIAAEEECCPFLSFELEEGRDEIVLTIRAPEEGRQIADLLAASFG